MKLATETRATKENGFKETEIGLLPRDWDVVRLTDQDVTNLIMGQSPPSSTYNESRKGLPFLQGKAEFGREYPSPQKWCTYPSRVAEKNDILISVRAPVGDVNIAPFQCAIGRGLAAIRADSKSLPYFLFYYLQFAKRRIEEEGTGSTFKAINKNVLKNLKIILPELDEQQKISSVLSKIQQAIEQQDKIIQIAKELKKSLMNNLFTEGLHSEEQKKTEIGMIPGNWEIKDINAIADQLVGGGTPSTKIREYWGGSIHWTTSKRLGEHLYLFDGEKKISEQGLNNSSTSLVPKNNLLISTRVTVGKVVVNKEDIAISQDLTGMLINKNFYNAEFLAYQIKTDRIQKIFAEQKRGATIKGITREDLKRIELAVPDLKEQNEIASIFLCLDTKLIQAQSRKQALQDLFKSMLKQLMTGRVRVKDLDIEVN